LLAQSAGEAKKTRTSGIQEAILRVTRLSPKIGGTVFVMSGEYHIKESIVIPSDFILLTGSREWGAEYTTEVIESSRILS
jgi:hypothetical protein